MGRALTRKDLMTEHRDTQLVENVEFLADRGGLCGAAIAARLGLTADALYQHLGRLDHKELRARIFNGTFTPDPGPGGR